MEFEIVRLNLMRQRREIVEDTIEGIAARVRAARGRGRQFRARDLEQADALEEGLRKLGLVSCRDGRLVSAWDDSQRGEKAGTEPQMLSGDEWLDKIKAWLAESPARQARPIYTAEVAERCLAVEPTHGNLARISKRLKALGYKHCVIGPKRLNAWKPDLPEPSKYPFV